MSHCPDPQDSITICALAPTVPQLILRAAVARESQAASPALIDATTGRTISYRQLISETRRTAKALAQHGLQKGEVVCLYSPNLPEYAVAVLAVTMAGGVVTLAAPTIAVEQLTQQLRVTQARTLLTTKRLLNSALLAASQTAVQQIYSFDTARGAHHFAELFETVLQADETPTEALLDTQRDGMAWLFAPDASEPQGVRHTHAAVVAQLQGNAPNAALTSEGAVSLSAVSFAEEAAFFALLHALWQGLTVTI